MILAGISFMIVNFFVKILGNPDASTFLGGFQKYPAHEIVLARSIVSFSISAWIIKRRKLPFFGNNKKWLIIRGTTGMIALTIFFYTIHYLPLAIASILQYLAPIFTVIFAIFILNEKVKLQQWVFILVAFSGVALIGYDQIFNPSNYEDGLSATWIGLAIISAIFSGIAYNAIVKLKPTDEPINIVMYFPMISLPIMSIWCLWDFTMPQGWEWLILLIIGIFTQIAQILMTKAFHFGPTSVIAPFQYLGAIYAFLMGYFIFNETLSFVVNIGITLVLLGVVTNSVLRKR